MPTDDGKLSESGDELEHRGPVEEVLDEEGVSDEAKHKIGALFARQYSGPYPPPDYLEQYGRIVPNAPELIFEQFARQGDHRREIEKRLVDGSESRAARGQWLVFILIVLVLLISCWLIFEEAHTQAATIITTVFVSSIVAYVAGVRNTSHKKSD
ncbi:DUF2335 domain-containing protein [Nesterenkonia populi]